VRCTRPGLLLTVRTADCLPILLVSESEGLALVHAGWRGLVAGVVEAAAETFSRPDRLVAVIGPAIAVCCFEVGPEVAARFPEVSRVGGVAGKERVDLPGDARRRLLAAGLDRGRIATGAPCTRCHQHLLHSHRGSGGAPGRVVAFARLSDDYGHAS
jgi:copper oxidase (laccase) domain-containing protein